MPHVTTQLEIAASSADVRTAFLDFKSYPKWAKAHLVGMAVASGDTQDIKPGDLLQVSVKGKVWGATVKTNEPSTFTWLGGIPILFNGEHSLHFQPSKLTPGHTTLIQEETFTGLLFFVGGENWSQGKELKAGFEAFNAELNAWVEGEKE